MKNCEVKILRILYQSSLAIIQNNTNFKQMN
jgi:hypothetical protein